MRLRLVGNGGMEVEVFSNKTNIEGKSNLEFTFFREGKRVQACNVHLVDNDALITLGNMLQESAL